MFFSTDSLFWEFRNGRGHQVFSQLEWKILACGFHLISRPLEVVNYRQKWPFFVLFKTNVVNIFLKIIMKAYSCLVSNGNNRKNSTKFWVGKGRGGFLSKEFWRSCHFKVGFFIIMNSSSIFCFWHLNKKSLLNFHILLFLLNSSPAQQQKTQTLCF